ncbi:FeoB-associated Cys-rich membrane protein [Companilactobacillus hulinensis]|uniref:FeoB-associated Cys-rich membrane protein n=1 Tax=Companilactobacillus hulinensis TaxID=2486007 RepID=UPI000F786519|nr:FeoB-associated Cys-rich membrane protein [Companilactobacillus hulinensis]
MTLFINLLIAAIIVGLAGYEIFKITQKSKQGKCAGCDYKCEAKLMVDKARKQRN